MDKQKQTLSEKRRAAAMKSAAVRRAKGAADPLRTVGIRQSTYLKYVALTKKTGGTLVKTFDDAVELLSRQVDHQVERQVERK
jgi:hypothetical protein